tara:strand:- start:529 stop:1821 length:1293 start_codon:yes stop_codon:yes gene_type:complete
MGSVHLLSKRQIVNQWEKENGQSSIYNIYRKGEFYGYQTKLKRLDGSVKQITSKDYDKLLKKIEGQLKKIDEGKILVKRPKATIISAIHGYVEELRKQTKVLDRQDKPVVSIGNFNYKSGLAKVVMETISKDETLSKKNINSWQGYDMVRVMAVLRERSSSANVLGAYLRILKDSFFHAMNTNDFDIQKENPVVQYKKNPINMAELKVDPFIHINETMNLIERWHIPFVNKFTSSINDPVYKILIRLCFSYGLRIGEALALSVDDFIDKVGNIAPKLDVYGQISKDEYKRITKTPSGKRLIPVGKGLADELREYIKFRKESVYDSNCDALFPYDRYGQKGYHIYRTAHKQLMRYTVDEFELPNNHKFHFFRHWCITSWKRNAIHTGYDISRFVGHKNPAVTERLYTHLYCTQLEEEHRVDKQDYLDNLLF